MQDLIIVGLFLAVMLGGLWHVLVYGSSRQWLVAGRLPVENNDLTTYATRGVSLGLSGLLLMLAGVEIFLCVFTIVVAAGGAWVYYAQIDEESTSGSWREVVGFCKEYALILTAIFLVRNFLVQHYQVPTGSLEPTVRPGDFILVNQFAYGWHVPIVNTKLLSYGDPQRGDVVVFRYPPDPYKLIYVKRCVGVPGDHVVYRNKRLTINGEEVKQDYLGPDSAEFSETIDGWLSRRKEYFPGVTHDILVRDGDYSYPKDEVDIVVPEGAYYMMGDNRDNSLDSRFWGVVEEKYIMGKAMMILLSWDWGVKSYWPNFSRSGFWL